MNVNSKHNWSRYGVLASLLLISSSVIAEKPEALGPIILLVAIPETMVILGFAVAAMVLLLGG